jgi:hypothetical protein
VLAVGLRQDASRREVIHFCVVSLLRAKMPSSNAPSVGDGCLSLQCTRTRIFAFAYPFAWTVEESLRPALMLPHPISLGHAGLNFTSSHPIVRTDSSRRANGLSTAVMMVVEGGEGVFTWEI